MENEKDMKDAIDETTVLPEAPESLHIDAYYKGFHFGITKRSRTARIMPYIDDAIAAIEYMLTKDCKPSWNDQTNNTYENKRDPDPRWIREPIEQTERPSRTVVPGGRVNKDDCPHDGGWTEEISQSEKNPGRHYKKCDKCGAFMGWIN